MIQSLIDKNDNFEIIRDKIAEILVLETASQMALAETALKEPNDWKLRVYTERSNPWEEWLNEQEDESPIVNIWFDSASFDAAGSNVVERQKVEGTFNIDCYGFGASKDNPSGGHHAGDELAAFKVHKAIRLVRNIIMSSQYTYLGLRGMVWQRFPQSITVFQPQQDAHTAQQIVGARLALRVTFNEFSPQYEGDVLEYVSVKVKRAENGEIVINADYEYPL